MNPNAGRIFFKILAPETGRAESISSCVSCAVTAADGFVTGCRNNRRNFAAAAASFEEACRVDESLSHLSEVNRLERRDARCSLSNLSGLGLVGGWNRISCWVSLNLSPAHSATGGLCCGQNWQLTDRPDSARGHPGQPRHISHASRRGRNLAPWSPTRIRNWRDAVADKRPDLQE